MKAYDYNAVVYGECTVLCVECLPAGVTPESDECHPIFASDEWDYYPVCDACGREHDYVGLTTCGEEIRARVLAGQDW